MKKVQHLLEFAFVKSFFTLLSYTPLPIASFLGYATGHLLTLVPSGILKKSAKQLAMAMPHLTDEEKKKIAKRSAIHMMQTFFEAPRIFKMPAKRLTKMLNIKESVKIEDHKGAILLTAHFGNWEALLRLMSIKGLDSAAIYRPANNALVDKIILDMRAKTGIDAIPKGRRGARQLIQACREGKYVGILNDQRNTDGQPIKLFGREAWTSIGFADMAIKYNRSVIPFFCRRTGFGRYNIEILPELHINSESDTPALVLAQSYNDVLEEQIRKYPEQWMWQHKRFK